MAQYRSMFSLKKTATGGQNLIARKILLYILLFSSFVTLLVTSLQLYSDYQEQAGLVDQKMVEVERSYHDSLGNAIWFFNVRQVESILAGVIKFEDIHYVSVQLESGKLYHAGEQRENINLRHYQVDVSRTMRGRVVKVGRLSIESNLEGVVQRLGDKFWLILISQAVKTFFVSTFILFIIHYFITRHLASISFFAAQLDINEKDEFLELNREKTTPEDELDQIAQAMNQMKRNLIRDAAERERSDAELRKLSQAIEQSSASIMILSTEAEVEYVNRKFEQSTGLDKDQVLGLRSDSLVFGDHPPEAYLDIWRDIASGNKWRGEQSSRQKNGSLLWQTVSVSAITGADENVTNFLVFKDDITDLKKSEDDLRRAHKMEAIGQLTGGIAHDFNNIIGIIIGNLELLQVSYLNDANIQKRLGNALKASYRAGALTTRLLQFSRKEAEINSLISINDFIGGIEDLLSKSLTAAISVRLNLADELWQVEIDSGDLEDAILNLSLNARDAMPSGGNLTITTQNTVVDDHYVKSHPECAVGEYVFLSVVDTGTGMTDEVKEQVLHPFFTTKEQGKGTGLGLSMVYAFVQRSSGYINISSVLNEGTSVDILLPRSKMASTTPSNSEQQQTNPEQQVINTSASKGVVLVVDDEAALCELACVNLTRLGYKTLSATNAQQALTILESEVNIDLLFSDIIMPGGIDGFQLAVEAKSRNPSLKVVLTSGFAKHPQAFVGSILQKPYTHQELAAEINLAMKISPEQSRSPIDTDTKASD